MANYDGKTQLLFDINNDGSQAIDQIGVAFSTGKSSTVLEDEE
jgi:hypothetical protein